MNADDNGLRRRRMERTGDPAREDVLPLDRSPRRRRANLLFVRRLLALNLRAALAYRAGFLTGAGLMALSDVLWITFWGFYFHRFPVVNGWELNDIVTTWAVVALGFGIAVGLCNNCAPQGVREIIEGRFDYYLTLPKNPLLHFLFGRIGVMALGDVVFALVVYPLMVRPGPLDLLLFTALALNAALVFLAFGVIVNALAFYLGNSEAVSNQLQSMLITFSTYPLNIFSTGVKLFMFVVVPAGFVSYLPIRVLRDFSAPLLLAIAAFTICLVVGAYRLFFHALARYESGNLVTLRG